jgi:hypothetical protein
MYNLEVSNLVNQVIQIEESKITVYVGLGTEGSTFLFLSFLGCRL